MLTLIFFSFRFFNTLILLVTCNCLIPPELTLVYDRKPHLDLFSVVMFITSLLFVKLLSVTLFG